VTGKGPCDSAVCVTAAGYAIKTDAGYTIKTSTTLQMTATGYWSDGTSLDLTPIATWDCTPSPVCGSVSANGFYTTGSSAGSYHVAATFYGVTNDGGSGIAVTAATISAQSKEHDRSEEHTSELQSHLNLVCRLLLEKKKRNKNTKEKIKQHEQH